MDPLKIVVPMLIVIGVFIALIIIICIPDMLAAFIRSNFWFNTRQMILDTFDGYRGIFFGCRCEDCCWNTQPDFCFQSMPGIKKKKKKPHCPEFEKRRN